MDERAGEDEGATWTGGGLRRFRGTISLCGCARLRAYAALPKPLYLLAGVGITACLPLSLSMAT